MSNSEFNKPLSNLNRPSRFHESRGASVYESSCGSSNFYREKERFTSLKCNSFNNSASYGNHTLTRANPFYIDCRNNRLGFNTLRNNRISSNSLSNMCFRPDNSTNLHSSRVNFQEDVLKENLHNGSNRLSLFRSMNGNNSVMSSRFFSQVNSLKYNRSRLQMSQTSGFIGPSDTQILIERKQALMDNMMANGSITSVSSVKAQYVNILESLQYSLTCSAQETKTNPLGTSFAQVINTEFEKVKEKLDSIFETSFAPTLRNFDASSVISFSKPSTEIVPKLIKQTTAKKINISLNSHGKLMQNLCSQRLNNKKQINDKSTNFFEAIKLRNEENEDSALDFKKPKPVCKGRKNNTKLKINTSQSNTSLAGGTQSKIINLYEWYPVAENNKLFFCGTDNKGKVLKTQPVKKRINSRKILLDNGFECELLGNPSDSIGLPKKILLLLKNGLTNNWKVLQKELLNIKFKANKTSSKQTKTSKQKVKDKKKSVSPNPKQKITCPTDKSEEPTTRSRSGRVIKPPKMYWLV